MVKKLFILLLIVVFYVFPKQIYAQQCINGGVTCCVEGTGPNGDYDDCAYSYPGSCDSSCNGECSDGGAPKDSACYYTNQQPGGGGGAYSYPTCGGGTVLKCGNNPTIYAPATTIENCFFRGSCGDDYFPSLFTDTTCDGGGTKESCQSNCGCCAPTDSYTKSTTTGGTYSKTVGCFTSNALACNDWDDTVVTRTLGTAATTCYCDCPDSDLGCGAQCNKNGGAWRYNDTVTCRTVTTTWSCVPNCTSSAPSVTTFITIPYSLFSIPVVKSPRKSV